VLPAWYMNGGPDPDVALALGRGQAAARVGEASKVAPLLFTRVAQLRTAGRVGMVVAGRRHRWPRRQIDLGLSRASIWVLVKLSSR